jgi:chemotaxis protein methyltransferase CheR
MHDAECVAFLQWALPRMGMRWRGMHRVRRQACKRIDRRMRELGVADVYAYRAYLDAHDSEWAALEDACRITISRFFRDRGVFEDLARHVLPALASAATARGATELRCWSLGCASGEEPYSLAMLWRDEPPLHIVATDADPHMIERAERGCYSAGSLKEVPPDLLAEAFDRRGDLYRIRSPYRERIELRVQNLRREQPDGPFDLVLCRNLAFTYFDDDLQREILARIAERLRGALVIGGHETLPASEDFEPWPGVRCIYRTTQRAARSTIPADHGPTLIP